MQISEIPLWESGVEVEHASIVNQRTTLEYFAFGNSVRVFATAFLIVTSSVDFVWMSIGKLQTPLKFRKFNLFNFFVKKKSNIHKSEKFVAPC